MATACKAAKTFSVHWGSGLIEEAALNIGEQGLEGARRDAEAALSAAAAVR
jgi:hypothetical protein